MRVVEWLGGPHDGTLFEVRPGTKVVQVSEASLRSVQAGISAPITRPLLLPKSETTTRGPSWLIVASGLLATSMPMNRVDGTAAASAGVQSVLSAGTSASRRSTYSASTAPNPPENTSNAG